MRYRHYRAAADKKEGKKEGKLVKPPFNNQ